MLHNLELLGAIAVAFFFHNWATRACYTDYRGEDLRRNFAGGRRAE